MHGTRAAGKRVPRCPTTPRPARHWRRGRLARRPVAGDIVVSTRPIAPSERIIKRVTATEGQQVQVFSRGELAPLVVKVRVGGRPVWRIC
jgi:hypothetical protein